MTPADLASFFRSYKFFRTSGAKENEIESFIANINSGYIPPGKAIELINQIYEISKSESVSPDQLPGYMKQKLEEKQKIDQEIQQADATLQSKNVSIEAINEYLKLSEELDKHGLSFQDIDKLLNVLVNAKDNGFDGKKIVGKLKKIQRLQNKEDRLKHHCEILSGQVKECNNVLPLAQKIKAMNIDIKELLVFDATVNQIARQYNVPASVAALCVFNEIRDYNKIGGLKKERDKLWTQVFAARECCFHQNKSMMAMLNLQSRGITEEKIISLSNILIGNQSSL
jgi:hypothetical protein